MQRVCSDLRVSTKEGDAGERDVQRLVEGQRNLSRCLGGSAISGGSRLEKARMSVRRTEGCGNTQREQKGPGSISQLHGRVVGVVYFYAP